MTKQDFENALDRSVEAMLDGGQPGIDDILLISEAVGGADLELMSKDERDTYLFGVEAGYKLGIGESCQAWFWEDNMWKEKPRGTVEEFWTEFEFVVYVTGIVVALITAVGKYL